jgi:predicted nucleic-acid-binding protein
MRGIDTNVLLRTVDLTDPARTAAVEHLLDEAVAEPLFVHHIVLCEFAWTLERLFKLSRSDIALRLHHVLEAPEFAVQQPAWVEQALKNFEASNAQFADCLIGVANLASGCSTTMTFDRDAAAIEPLFSPLPT